MELFDFYDFYFFFIFVIFGPPSLPAVAKILAALKKSNYKDLPILMQRIEAKCILDHCSKKAAKKYPKLPLICRHDSLSTTVDWSAILEQEFTGLLNNYFDVEVKVGVSDW